MDKDRYICQDCGESVVGRFAVVMPSGQWICLDCLEEYAKCRDCGNYHRIDEMHTLRTGEYICDDCYDENYVTCRDCGDVVKCDDAYELPNGEYICVECYDENYFTCDDCGEIHRTIDAIRTADGRYICSSRDSDYTSCNRCEEVFANNEVEEGSDGEYYCSGCMDRRRENGEEDCDCDGVMGYHEFDAGKYEPILCNGEDRGEPTFGVELECDKGEFHYDEFYDHEDIVHFEYDGSLSDSGVEMITMPMTLRAHMEKADWPELTRLLLRQGFLSHDTATCGMHVHIGRDALTVMQIVKLDVWLNRWMLWRDIARRDCIYNGEYDNAKRIDLRHCAYRHPSAAGCLEKYANAYVSGSRYQPLNTNNASTVEIRIFRGTLKVETILGTLEAIHGLLRFAKLTPCTKIYDRNLPVKFTRFLADHGDEYPHVMPMLSRLAKQREPGELLGIVRKAVADSTDSGDR